jgi:hypothetical protein
MFDLCKLGKPIFILYTIQFLTNLQTKQKKRFIIIRLFSHNIRCIMMRQLKTKLLKIVCKRSELTRARFRGSLWTSKISQTDNKSLFVNKTGEKFRSKVAKLSVGKSWSSIQEVCIIEKYILHLRILLINDYYSICHKRNGSLSNKFNCSDKVNSVYVDVQI